MKDTPYWWEHAPPTEAPSSALPARTDVAVIGAGYTGLSAALTLARAGRSVVVLDAGMPGIGASSRNGGMLGDWLRPSFDTLLRRLREAARRRADRRGARGIRIPAAASSPRNDIDCNYALTGGFTGMREAGDNTRHWRARPRQLSRRIGIEADMVPKSEVRNEIGTDLYCGGRVMHRRGGLHPARYHAGLIERVRVAQARQ